MAAGDTLVFDVLAHEPALNSSQSPSLGRIGSRMLLGYDAAVEEHAHFRNVLSTGYAGGGFRVDVWWTCTSTSTAIAVWGAAFERAEEAVQSLASDSYATEKTGNSAGPGVANAPKKISFTFSNSEIDGALAGECFRTRIARKATDASDALTINGHLYQVVVVET